eukprot:11500622-Ditylum_brightwellii.AAC.1
MAPSVEDIAKVFPQTFIPKILSEPDYKQLYEVHRLLMENTALIDTTIAGGLHGHLGLVITQARYLQLTGHPFVPPQNPGPTPIMSNQFMTAAEAEIIRQNHRLQLAVYNKFLNTDKALKNQLLHDIDDRYTKALKQGMIGYTHRTTMQLLKHLYCNYGRVTPMMLSAADTQLWQPFNPSLPIEDFFERFDEVKDLCTAGGSPYSDAQLIDVAYDAIFKSAVHNDGCKEWIRLPPAQKTWANFCMHFTDQH